MSVTNKGILGAGLIQHLKAYIDQEIDLKLVPWNTDTTTETDGSTSTIATHAGDVFFIDPFSVNNSPLSLSLPAAFQHISPTLAANADSDIVIVTVVARSWDVFYSRLLSAAIDHAEFLETATRVQERIGLSMPPEAGYLPETVVIPANSSSSALSHWLTQHDQVYSSVLVTSYPMGELPEALL